MKEIDTFKAVQSLFQRAGAFGHLLRYMTAGASRRLTKVINKTK
jgi:hypothetical protein